MLRAIVSSRCRTHFSRSSPSRAYEIDFHSCELKWWAGILKAHLKVERLVIHGDSKCIYILIVDTDYGALQPHTTSPDALHHFLAWLNEKGETLSWTANLTVPIISRSREHIFQLISLSVEQQIDRELIFVSPPEAADIFFFLFQKRPNAKRNVGLIRTNLKFHILLQNYSSIIPRNGFTARSSDWRGISSEKLHSAVSRSPNVQSIKIESKREINWECRASFYLIRLWIWRNSISPLTASIRIICRWCRQFGRRW